MNFRLYITAEPATVLEGIDKAKAENADVPDVFLKALVAAQTGPVVSLQAEVSANKVNIQVVS